MKKAYYIINTVTFLVMAFYSSVSQTSYQLSHTIFMMCLVSLVVSGYMTFMEYTDTSEEDRTEQFNNIRSTYKKRMEDISKKEHTYDTLEMENKDLVRDLTYTKQMAHKLASIIEDQDQGPSQDHDQDLERGEIGQEMDGQEVTMEMELERRSNQMQGVHEPETMSRNQPDMMDSMRPISNTSNIGPPEVLLTSGDPNNLEESVKEYNQMMPTKTAPRAPDWLKPMETSKTGGKSGENGGTYNPSVY
jgi:hypothetical protein